jgi:hypothetical protein
MENEDVPYTARYPKYFTKFSLLGSQLRDPNFRKTWICQVILCIWVLKNPMKIAQKKVFDVDEKNLDKLSNIEKSVIEYAKTLKEPGASQTFYDLLSLFLERERRWSQWKEENCQPFEKPTTSQIQTKFEKARDYLSIVNEIYSQTKTDPKDAYPNWKSKDRNYKKVADSSDKLLKISLIEAESNLFSYLTPYEMPT